jgi:hypothetical protein
LGAGAVGSPPFPEAGYPRTPIATSLLGLVLSRLALLGPRN